MYYDKNKFKDLMHKHVPEKINANEMFESIKIIKLQVQKYLDDNPKEKVKLLKLLDEDES